MLISWDTKNVFQLLESFEIIISVVFVFPFSKTHGTTRLPLQEDPTFELTP